MFDFFEGYPTGYPPLDSPAQQLAHLARVTAHPRRRWRRFERACSRSHHERQRLSERPPRPHGCLEPFACTAPRHGLSGAPRPGAHLRGSPVSPSYCSPSRRAGSRTGPSFQIKSSMVRQIGRSSSSATRPSSTSPETTLITFGGSQACGHWGSASTGKCRKWQPTSRARLSSLGCRIVQHRSARRAANNVSHQAPYAEEPTSPIREDSADRGLRLSSHEEQQRAGTQPASSTAEPGPTRRRPSTRTTARAAITTACESTLTENLVGRQAHTSAHRQPRAGHLRARSMNLGVVFPAGLRGGSLPGGFLLGVWVLLRWGGGLGGGGGGGGGGEDNPLAAGRPDGQKRADWTCRQAVR